MSNIFDGTGLWVFNMGACSGSAKPETYQGRENMVTTLQLSGANWAAPKVANGILPYNRTGQDTYNGPDKTLPEFYDEMSARGFPRIGWQYLYGNSPIQEANVAIAQIKKYKLQGFLLDPETEYESLSKAVAANLYMTHLRAECPGVQIGLASWRFPSLHPNMPWVQFLDQMDASRGDVHMPQCYWEGDTSATGPGAQLARAVKELTLLKNLPVYPIGSAYMNRQKNLQMWIPTAAQMETFAQTAASLKLAGLSWWAWDTMVAKDAPSPAQAGKYGWWKTVLKESAFFEPGTQPAPALSWDQAIQAWAMGAGYDWSGDKFETAARQALDVWARARGYTGPKPE
jgi:hypothetical protein